MQLLAVNETGHESGMPTMSALGDLPILQDTTTVDAWTLWEVTYRDVVILDADNHYVGTYNLTTHDLGNPTNYAELQSMIEAAITP